MAKKKKEEKILEVKYAPKKESIKITFGDLETNLNIEDDKLVGIHLTDVGFSTRHYFVWHNEIEEAIAVFKKVIAIKEAMDVLGGTLK